VTGEQRFFSNIRGLFTNLKRNPFVEISSYICLTVTYNQQQNNTLDFYEILQEIFLQNFVEETRVS
jgi:hypothetical protein